MFFRSRMLTLQQHFVPVDSACERTRGVNGDLFKAAARTAWMHRCRQCGACAARAWKQTGHDRRSCNGTAHSLVAAVVVASVLRGGADRALSCRSSRPSCRHTFCDHVRVHALSRSRSRLTRVSLLLLLLLLLLLPRAPGTGCKHVGPSHVWRIVCIQAGERAGGTIW